MLDTLMQPQFLAAALIFVGSFVQATIGFGMAVVAVPLLYLYAPEYVPGPICFLALILSSMLAYKHRHAIELNELKPAFWGRVLGSTAGGFFLAYISTKFLALWIGALVMVAVGVSLMPVKIQPTPNRLGFAGFLSGFFATSSAIGGPPVALLMQHESAQKIRGGLAFFFASTSVFTLIVQACIGYFTWAHVLMTLPLIPVALAGYSLAMITTQNLPKEQLRIGILLLCFAAGFFEIVQTLQHL
jgi:uncharacterized membrane protein YfcA